MVDNDVTNLSTTSDDIIRGTAQFEAERFMAAVHGAMLSARAYGDDKAFKVLTEPLIERLVAGRP